MKLQEDAEYFWRFHNNHRNTQFGRHEPLSKAFKNLVTIMLQYNPSKRLSLVDVLAHAWLKGDIATHNEVVREFTQRRHHMD